MSKISVLVPVYNCEKYLNECINSIINQSFKDLEIILINDGSSDNSLEILKKFQKKDKRIILIDKKNTGYGSSLNKGIKIAKGEYISIIEADDFIDLNFYKNLMEYSNSNYEIIKSSFSFFQNNKKKKYDLFKHIKKQDNFNLKKNPNLILLKPSIWSAIYKKDFLLKNNIFFLETPKASYQDTSFQFQTYYFAKNIKLINKPLYFYRIDNTNSSINSKDKFEEIIKEFEKINNIFDNQTSKKLYVFKLLLEFKSYIWAFKRIKKEKRKDFINLISKIFNSYNLNFFYNDSDIRLKYKIKMFLLAKYKKLFYYILKHQKSISEAK